MKMASRWHGVEMIAVAAIGMMVAPLLATAGEPPARGAKRDRAPQLETRRQRPRMELKARSDARPTRRDVTPPRRTDRPPAQNRYGRGPTDAVTRPSPPRRAAQPPHGPLPEIARRILAGAPTDLFSDVMAKLLSDVAVKLLSGNEAELLSGNETELLSGNETELLSGNEPEILSGNRAQLLSGNAITVFSGNHISITVSDSGNNNGSELTKTASEEFSALDTNRDGRLSFQEFRARKMGRVARKEQKRFRRRDVDSDGLLSLREFALLQ